MNTKEKGRVVSPSTVELWDGDKATFRAKNGAYVVTVTDSEGIYSGVDLITRLSGVVAARHDKDYLLSALREKVPGATFCSEHLADVEVA